MLLTGPRYRASLLKSIMAMLVEDYASEQEEIVRGIDPEKLAEIGTLSRTSWIKADVMFDINAGIERVLGREGFAEFWLEFSRTATRTPLLKGLAEGAARLFGSGEGIIKLLPRSFALVSRELATLSIEESEEGRAIIRVHGFAYPNSLELFAEANRSSTCGALMMVGETPKAEIIQMLPELGGFRLLVQW